MDSYADIGVNLTASAFRDDCDAVIERALQAGVRLMIVTGTSLEASEQAIRLAERYDDCCYATAGIHPHHASEYTPSCDSELLAMYRHPKVVAAGECGLDFNRNFSPPGAQRLAFEAQLQLAVEAGLPVFLHQRDAHAGFLQLLRQYRGGLRNAVAHCFTGDSGQLRDYLALDMYIGITGWISDPRRGEALRQAVRELPLERLLLETDAPYLLPADLPAPPVKKRRNEPYLLPVVAEALARAMQCGLSEIRAAAWRNTQAFFFGGSQPL